jgi:hypothetical protein
MSIVFLFENAPLNHRMPITSKTIMSVTNAHIAPVTGEVSSAIVLLLLSSLIIHFKHQHLSFVMFCKGRAKIDKSRIRDDLEG